VGRVRLYTLRQSNGVAILCGINLYPAEPGDDWLEYDSMINVRPSQGNPSCEVESPTLREVIRAVVDELVERS